MSEDPYDDVLPVSLYHHRNRMMILDRHDNPLAYFSPFCELETAERLVRLINRPEKP